MKSCNILVSPTNHDVRTYPDEIPWVPCGWISTNHVRAYPATSNGSLEGVNNQQGGVCVTKAMKILMKVGQDPDSPGSNPNSNPSKRPDEQAGSNGKSSTTSPFVNSPASSSTDGKNSGHTSIIGSEVALFAGIASGCIIFIVIIITLV
ncbi:unnamed protein product, partial [Ranitomeya imitator]